MKPTTDPTTEARALIDSAAALAGMTTETPPPLYKDDPPREPLPCYVTDPTTGRRLHLHRITYPAGHAGRLSMSAEWPKDSKGCRHTPRTTPPAATVAPTTEPAALARRFRRYLEETREAHEEATRYAAQADDYAARVEATKAALVAAGWTQGQHDIRPPRIDSAAYVRADHIGADSVTLHIGGLTAAQAVEITRILTGTPDPCREFVKRYAARTPHPNPDPLDGRAHVENLEIQAARDALRP